jgi:anti-sigma regulatory factor (Ser/Thr protein kinase)
MVDSSKATRTEMRQVPAGDFSSAGQASAFFKNMLKKLGVNPSVVRRISIASYESEINLAIHSEGGTMTLSLFPEGISLKVEDTGPGIEDIALAMQEGYSTAPEEVRMLGFGAGMGLSNMKRCSDEFEVVSALGQGTTINMFFNL